MTDLLVANNGLSGSLTYSFSRDSATINDNGDSVAANVARYGKSNSLSTLSEWFTLGTIVSPGGPLASGYYIDGTTPLLVTVDGSNNIQIRLNTFGNIIKSIATATTTHAGAYDVLQGYSNQDPTIAYTAATGQICYGMIVLACRRFHWTGSAWEERGISILVSQDRGTSWLVAKQSDGTELPAQNNGDIRGNIWQLSGYLPMDEFANEVWFAVTDYQASGQPHGGGGQAALFRAKRTRTGTTYNIDPLYLVSNVTGSFHYHSALFLKPSDSAYAGKGYFIISRGDGTTGRLMSAICNDPENYWDSSNWGSLNEFAGGGDDNELADRGSINQFTSPQAIGYAEARALVSHDIDYACVSQLNLATDGTITFTTRYGVGGDAIYFDGLFIHCPTPEKFGPYVSRVTSTRSATQQRFIFSPEGNGGVNWSTISSTSSAGGGVTVNAPFIFGDYIIATQTGASIKAMNVPTDASYAKPLRIGPGSPATGNLIKSGDPAYFISPAANCTVTFPTRNSLSVAPPTPSTSPVARMIMDGVDGTSNLCATFAPNGLGAGIPMGLMTYRMHLRCIGNGRIVSRHGLGSQAQIALNIGPKTFGDNWLPQMSVNSNASIGDGVSNHWLGHWVYQHPNPAGTVGYKQSYELAWDLAYVVPLNSTSAALPGYSVLPGTVGGDEDFKINTGLTAAPWTLGLVVQIPHDSWDSTMSALVPTVPLFTLYGNSNNYIEFIGDLSNSRITVNAKANGSTTTTQLTGVFFQREDMLRFVVSNDGTTIGITVGVGGAGTLIDTTATATLATQPIDVRFEKADGTTACLDFYSCRIDSSAAYNSNGRKALALSSDVYTLPSTSSYLTPITVINQAASTNDNTRGTIPNALNNASDPTGKSVTRVIRNDKIDGFDKTGAPVSKSHTTTTLTDNSSNNHSVHYFSPFRIQSKEI